jgi:arginine/serine-rich splicing factor 4/5/6
MSKKMRKASKSRSRSASKGKRGNFLVFRKNNYAAVKASMPNASGPELTAAIKKMYYGSRMPSKTPVRRVRKAKRSVSKKARKASKSRSKSRKASKSRSRSASKKRSSSKMSKRSRSASKKTRRVRKAKRSASKKSRKMNEYTKFFTKYRAAKAAALGPNASSQDVMRALGKDWTAGIRSY